MVMYRPIPKTESATAGAMKLLLRSLRGIPRLLRSDFIAPAYASKGRKTTMATKTKAIKVTVDERLAEEIADKGVHCWHATNYSNGRRRVYVTFEEVKTVTAP